jgi:DNA-binding GntR family transcriptional regulator
MVDVGKLDPDDPRPPSVQLADVLRSAITGGQLGPGAQLPSYSALSAEYGVAPNTVKGALSALRAEGLIVSRQGKGSFVRTHRSATGATDMGGDDVRAGLADLRRRVEEVERRLDDVDRRSRD